MFEWHVTEKKFAFCLQHSGKKIQMFHLGETAYSYYSTVCCDGSHCTQHHTLVGFICYGATSLMLEKSPLLVEFCSVSPQCAAEWKHILFCATFCYAPRCLISYRPVMHARSRSSARSRRHHMQRNCLRQPPQVIQQFDSAQANESLITPQLAHVGFISYDNSSWNARNWA